MIIEGQMFNIHHFNSTQHKPPFATTTYWQPKYLDFINKYLVADLANVNTSLAAIADLNPVLCKEILTRPESIVVIKNYSDLVLWQESFQQMVEFTAQRNELTYDQILLLQHQPVFTQGINGKAEHILNNKYQIPIQQADRGGQVTYHGPRQQIIYLLIDFERKKREYQEFGIKFYARDLITAMENAVVNILQHLGIYNAHAKPDAPGIYVNNRKISSLGIKVTRHGTYHGIAINLDMDLDPFHSINPCGYVGLEMCNFTDFVQIDQLKRLGLVKQESEQLNQDDFYNLLQQIVTDYFVCYIVKYFAYVHTLDGDQLIAKI